jgi:2-hydroxy-6-oxonona-2,4-dienedioate hydrolase/4,5:9,10-diseco-3-hydroxy-5,9,17-trioxoandrosta-1(10),2-diene-4-oate hydrolase
MSRLLDLGQAECRSAFASIDGRRLHYLDSGAGQPVVLLHGAGGGAANWYRLIAPLAANFRVLLPDLPGYGFSDPIEPAAPLGHQVARVLADWLLAIGVQRPHLVGTSFGGLVALRLAQHTDVARIICIDAVGLSTQLSFRLRLATLPLFARFVVAPTRAGTRAMLRYALTSTRLSSTHENALVDYLFASAKRSDLRMLARAFAEFAGPDGQREVLTSEELSRLRERLLVVWGEQDNFLPFRGVEQACALAGCISTRMIPDAGHSPNWEQPDRLLKEIQHHLR